MSGVQAPDHASPTELLHHAQRYGALGLRVIKLHGIRGYTSTGKPICTCKEGENCKDAGKHPVSTGWKRQSEVPEDVQNFGSFNLGLPMGELVVLDVDGPEGAQSLERIRAQHGELPKGPVQITGSGGRHLLFKAPLGIKLPNAVKFKPGLDIRAEGGFIVTAPSLHKSNKRYHWTDPDLEPPEMPQWLAEMANGRTVQVRPDEYLERAPVAISGQGGSAVMMSVMATLVRGCKLREPADMMALIGPWNQRCEPPWTEKELRRGFTNALERFREDGRARVTYNKDGSPQVNLALVRRIVQEDPMFEGRLRYNAMAQYVEIDGERLDDYVINDERDAIVDRYSLPNLNARMVAEQLIAEARKHIYSPVVEYLDALDWDGQRRFGQLVDALRIRNGRNRRLGPFYIRKWMVSAVARARAPGCKVDTIFVLQGDEQGGGKSSALRALAEPWFSDSNLDLSHKDSFMAIAGIWIHEFQELASWYGKKDGNLVKAYISSQVDRYRPSHLQHVRDVPPSNVFCGTVNDRDFLTDRTGARRFWCLETEASRHNMIDLEWIRANRDQLWGEADAAFSAWKGESFWAPWWPTTSEEDAMQRLNLEFQPEDGVAAKVGRLLEEDPREFFRLADVIESVGVRATDQKAITTIDHALKSRGLKKTRRTVNGQKIRCYARHEHQGRPG
ncbi:MAG: VapE domain-containing protein [Myxococcota bacterium]